MKAWQAAAVVTGVVVVTLVLLLALDSRSGADEMLAPSSSEVAMTVTSLVVFEFGVLWLLFAVLRVKRHRRDGAQ